MFLLIDAYIKINKFLTLIIIIITLFLTILDFISNYNIRISFDLYLMLI